MIDQDGFAVRVIETTLCPGGDQVESLLSQCEFHFHGTRWEIRCTDKMAHTLSRIIHEIKKKVRDSGLIRSIEITAIDSDRSYRFRVGTNYVPTQKLKEIVRFDIPGALPQYVPPEESVPLARSSRKLPCRHISISS